MLASVRIRKWECRRVLRFVLVVLSCAFGLEAHADFKAELAKHFGAEPAHFILNLPPRPSSWPGTIYLPGARTPLVRGEPTDPDVAKGPLFGFSAGIKAEVSGEARVGVLQSLMGGKAAASEQATAVVAFREATIRDLTIRQIQERLGRLSDTERRAKGISIVYRSYEGIPTLYLTRKAGISAEAWIKIKKGLAEAGAEASMASDDVMSIDSKEKLVFAYEVYVADDVDKLMKAAMKSEWEMLAGDVTTSYVLGTGGLVASADPRPFPDVKPTSIIEPLPGAPAITTPGVVIRFDYRPSITFILKSPPSNYGLRQLTAAEFEQAHPAP